MAGAAIVFAPFGLLEFHTAAAVCSALLIASLLGALWILRVRDWRVLAVVITCAPVISAVRLGTLTPVLILLLAMAWRWRDRCLIVGGALAVAIALKLFLWPFVVWLLGTRRYAAAGVATGLAVGATFAAWAAIGFDGLVDYPALVRRLTEVVADRGYSLVALGVELGLPDAAADALPWLIGSSLLALAVASARRDPDSKRAFSLTVISAIALTPIVWLHYFALLVVPLALARPRFSWPWAVLWLFWITPGQQNDGDLWRIVLAVVLVVLLSTVVMRGRTLRQVA